jgi:hypothetical protein
MDINTNSNQYWCNLPQGRSIGEQPLQSRTPQEVFQQALSSCQGLTRR